MPKRRRAKSKSKARTTQSQRQSQRVTVNIGKTTVTKRKQSGRGALPPPSHMHNLAPTFVTAPQVDYVGLIGEISRLTRPVVNDPVPIRNPVTPLQSTLQASNAEKMAGEAAIRRAGPTAANFQPRPSMADERIRPPDEYVTERLVPEKPPSFGRASSAPPLGLGEETPVASSRPLRGRPRRDTQQAVPFGFGEGGGRAMVSPSTARPTLPQANTLTQTRLNQFFGKPLTEEIPPAPQPKSKKKLRIVPNPEG